MVRFHADRQIKPHVPPHILVPPINLNFNLAIVVLRWSA